MGEQGGKHCRNSALAGLILHLFKCHRYHEESIYGQYDHFSNTSSEKKNIDNRVLGNVGLGSLGYKRLQKDVQDQLPAGGNWKQSYATTTVIPRKHVAIFLLLLGLGT